MMGAINRKDYLFLNKINRHEKLEEMKELEPPFGVSNSTFAQITEHIKFCNERFAELSLATINQKGIKYVSKHMTQLFEEYVDSSSLLKDLITPLKSQTGLLLFPNGLNILYNLFKDRHNNRIDVEAFVSKNNDLIGFSRCGYNYEEGILEFSKEGDFDLDGIALARETTRELLLFLSFLQVIAHESKIINENRSSKNRQVALNGINYSSNSKYPIEVIGTTWYTSTNRIIGFPVMGHFRNQPCGFGRAQRKVVWIDPFQKNGYKRIAKMLNNKKNDNYGN